MQPNPLIQQYNRTLSLYYKFKRRLERRLKNHSLQELSVNYRNRLLHTLERLKRRLASLELQLKLGVVSTGFCVSMGSLEDGLAQSPIPAGTEFQVNTYTTSHQEFPAVAMDSDGEYVITWESDEQDGSGYGIYAQRYNASGVAQGSEFLVNTYTTNHQVTPAIAMDSDGDFVIAWTRFGQGGSDNGIYAQRYNATGVAQGSEFQVNSYTTSFQSAATIAMDNDGDFVIAWNSDGQDGSDHGIYAQRYNAAGGPQGAEFQVNTYTTNQQTEPSIAMDSQGEFVIAWASVGQDGSGDGVYAQSYNASGVAQGGEFQVNTFTTSHQGRPSIAMDNDGNFVVAWGSYYQDGSDVYAQRYNAAGVTQGTEFQVNSYTETYQHVTGIAMDSDGDFMITWSSGDSYLGQDGDGYGIYAQRYNAVGDAQGSEFRVNAYTTSHQLFPSIAMDNDGDFVITWQSGQDGANYGVFAQRYYGPNPDLPPVSEANSELTVDEGASQTINSNHLAFSDPDNPNSEITYVITGLPQNGMLSRNENDLALDDTFTQKDINKDLIRYQHDGSETTEDAFNFEVNDGKNFLTEETFSITVNPQNDPPELANNKRLNLDEGGEALIRKQKLKATDVDNKSKEISFKLVQLPVNGNLFKQGEPLEINEKFTQRDINLDRISYQHDGSETTEDSFQFKISDGEATLKKATFELTVNPVDDLITGLSGTNNRLVQLYPNPVQDLLRINVTALEGADIHLLIISSQGKTVRERTYSVVDYDLIEIDFSRFTPGLYILRLSDGKRNYWGKVQKL